MGTKERREREKDQVRAAILDAARELFVAYGYEGVSMRAIAEKIEYSPTVIYNYFKDKDALISELCQSDFGRLADHLHEAARIADPAHRLCQCGREYVRFALSHPNHYRLMFMTPYPQRPGDPVREQAKAEIKGNPETDAYAFLLALVQQVADAGSLRGPNPNVQLVAQTLWAGLHGVISLQIALGADKDRTDWAPVETRTDAMLDALTFGLFSPDALPDANSLSATGASEAASASGPSGPKEAR
jgi:AcrR family transcriptional regulator